MNTIETYTEKTNFYENKPQILRDELAIDRTKLANTRTLLSMVRTGLYFLISGLSFYGLPALIEYTVFSWVFFLIGLIIWLVGGAHFFRVKKKLIEANLENKIQ